MKTPRDSDSLVAVIAPLAKQIAAIQRQMRALDMFTNDRELLDCPHCGLREDVLISGRLITYREPDFHQDTGLRFGKLTADTFRCPSCGQTVCEPLAENMQGGASSAKPATKRPKRSKPAGHAKGSATNECEPRRRSPNGAKEASPGQGAQRRRPGSHAPKHVEP